jgi:hypothetical protein
MVHRVGHAAGVDTGLVWADTEWVVATVTPTIEDRTAAMLDQAMDCYAAFPMTGRPEGSVRGGGRVVKLS